jgi:hypothetical protein
MSGSDSSQGNAFQHMVLKTLYEDACKARQERGGGGEIADFLEVQCFHEEESGFVDHGLVAFYLHPCIASTTSDYFRSFPDPLKKGRILEEIDASTFGICAGFMYLGPMIKPLSHETVASVLLGAANFLLIPELSNLCFKYLEQNLDHDNFETVKELSEQFSNPMLAQQALRFRNMNMTRDELVKRKYELAEEILNTQRERKSADSQEQQLKNILERTECQ